MTKLDKCKSMIKTAMHNKKEDQALIDKVDQVTSIDGIFDLLLETKHMPLGFTYRRIDRIMA